MESAKNELAEVKQKLTEVNDTIDLYSREITETNEYYGGKGDRISKLAADLDQLRRDLPVEIVAGDKIKTENEALSVALDQARAELSPSEKLIRSYTVEFEVACLRKKHLSPKAATDCLAKQLESRADEIISTRGKDIQKLTQDTKQLKDKVSELQSRLHHGIEKFESQKLKISNMQHAIGCIEENIAQTKMEKETGDSLLEMLVEWLQGENKRREQLLRFQAELEEYCEKSTIRSEKEQTSNMAQVV
jgi:chromosome segregation ATPase